MATIVQPYNPWREQLAANVLVPFLGDLWQQHRQNEQNKKVNAFRGQLQQDLQNIAGQGNISLTQPQNVPEGYNSNPWANAFHQNNSPLEQFDIGTSQRQPSIQEIASMADNLAATPRFSMLNPATVSAVKNNMLQRAYADMFGNAQDTASQLKALTMGTAEGIVPHQALTAFSPWAVHNTPHQSFENVDTGTSIITQARDPKSGSVRTVASTPVGMSDYQRASLQTQRDIAQLGAEAQRYGYDTTAGVQYAQFNQAREDARIKAINDQINILEERKRDILSTVNDPKAAQQATAPIDAEIARLRNSLIPSSNQTAFQPISDGGQWQDLINKYSQANNLDPDLVWAVIQVESGHKNGLTSPAGALGLMQLMPNTARSLGVNDSFDPEQNIDGGTRYLRQMLDMFGGNVEKALLAYNAGPGAIKAGRNPNPKYARDVLAIYNRRKLSRQNNNPTNPQPQPQTQYTPMVEGNPYLVHQDGSVITDTEFQRMKAKSGLSDNALLQQLKQRGFNTMNNSRLDISAPLGNSPIFRKPEYSTQQDTTRQGKVYSSPDELADEQGIPSSIARLFLSPQDNTSQPTTATASDDVTGELDFSQDNSSVYRGLNRSGLTPYSEYQRKRPQFNNMWSLADFISSLRQNNSVPDHSVLTQNFLNHPPLPFGVPGLNTFPYLYSPQVMEFPIKRYPYSTR